jgi:hypothetical protein
MCRPICEKNERKLEEEEGSVMHHGHYRAGMDW